MAGEFASRMFRSEQKRHHTATAAAIESIVTAAADIKRFHDNGHSVSGELRSLMQDVLRAFERASQYEALKEVEFIVEDSQPEGGA